MSFFIYELRKEIFNESKKYAITIYENYLKKRNELTIKEKNLDALVQNIPNEYISNEFENEIITTISAPQIKGGSQTLPLNTDELLEFYKKFQSKSYTHLNRLKVEN